MDRVIIMKRVNVPAKDMAYTYNKKDDGAIRDAITRYFGEYLYDNGETNLSINLLVVLIRKTKRRLTNFKP